MTCHQRNRAGSGFALVLALAVASCGSSHPPVTGAVDPRVAYDEAKDKLARRKCMDAREILRRLSLEHAGVTYIDSIVYNLAEAYMCEEDYILAQLEYERVINSYPSSALLDDAAFGLAYAQFKQAPRTAGLDQTQAENAVRSMQDFIALYPRSDQRARADSLLSIMRNRLARKTFDAGRLYLKLEADSAAMIYFQQLWDDYTESPYAARALWLLAEQARQKEQWDLAIKRYEQLIQVYPNAIEVERAKVFLQRIQAQQADLLWEQAEQARRAGRLDEALGLYEKFLVTYPEDKHIGQARQQVESLRATVGAQNGG